MKRTAAHITLTLMDILMLVAIYMICSQVIDVLHAISAKNQFIEFNTRIYLPFVGAVLALSGHIITVIEALLPSIFKWSGFKKAVSLFWLLTIVFAILTSNLVKNHILSNDYMYCAGASKPMKVSHFAVYVLNDEICHKLTTEKEKSKLSSIH